MRPIKNARSPLSLCIAKRQRSNYLGGDMDTNYWGLWCVPLGLFICFGPALIAAALTKPTDSKKNPK